MDKNIFDVITEYAVNEAVNSTLLQNGEYKRIQAEINSLTDGFDKMNLPKEQRLEVAY